MRLPSVKALRRIANDDAPLLRKVLEADTWDKLGAIMESGRFPRSLKWYYDCLNRPRFSYAKMVMADELIGTYGIEYIPCGKNRRSPAIEYCNTGDTYAETLMRVDGVFKVGCWGDIVERGNYE